MPSFQFDDKKSFDENLDRFLEHMEIEDPDLGAILRLHVDKLKVATDDASRRRARTQFNDSIVAALDEKLKEKEDE